MILKNFLRKLIKNNSGATAIEYALIAALIIFASVGAISTLSSTFIDNYESTSAAMDDAANR
ncbi:MAG: Flp family type IVb pilin [Emcibacter sp.]|nr:Flp family type IVb pilin [Emcibacter sp.]